MLSHNPSPKALLFDFGNVFIQVEFDRTWLALCQLQPQLTRDEFYAFLHSHAHLEFELGQLTPQAFFRALGRQLRLDATPDILCNAWNLALGDAYADIDAWIHRLAQRLPLYMFSNTNETHYLCWKEKYRDLLRPLRQIFTSHELGMRKPSHAAFRSVLKQMNMRAADVMFFDDRPENTAAAQQVGMTTVQVRDAGQLSEVLCTLYQTST